MISEKKKTYLERIYNLVTNDRIPSYSIFVTHENKSLTLWRGEVT